MKAFISYLVCLAMFTPALLATSFGGVNLSFWDWYEGRFDMIAFAAFIPFFFTSNMIQADFLDKLLFNVSGVWMIFLALPDLYVNWNPVNYAYISELDGWWFGGFSALLIVINVALYYQIFVKARKARLRPLVTITT